MVVSSEVANLAMSVVAGAVKLGKRLDQMMAEEEAVRGPLALPFANMVKPPRLGDMKRALKGLLEETAGMAPDPLGAGRARIGDALASGERSALFEQCEKHNLVDSLTIEVFKPDAEFEKALRNRSQNWNLAEPDIRRYTYFLAAGRDLRNGSLGFRIAAATIDVVTEVAAQNTRFVIDHEPTRKLVESILTRFSEPDLASMGGWSAVLQQTLRSTLNVVLDQRDEIARNEVWLQHALSGLARVRERSGDDFVLGLLRGTGFDTLFSALLAEGAEYLSDGDEEVWEAILADVLVTASERAEGARSFEAFFQENWHLLFAAGLGGLQQHGPKLLDEDDAILESVLTAAVGALADSFAQGPPNADTLSATIQAAVGVFADPGVLAPSIREEWLRELIASVAGTVRDDGLRGAFTKGALEGYARDTLSILSQYPEVLAADSEVVQKILTDVLGRMSQVETFGVGSLADTAVEGALSAFAANAELLDTKYASVLGDLAGELAERVANGGLAGLQADALIGAAAEVLATNDFLFVKAREGLAGAVVAAVLGAAEAGSSGLLAGAALVATAERALAVVATFGLGLPANASTVEDRLKEILAAALEQAEDAIGRELAQSDLPTVLVALIEKVSRGESIPVPGTPEFEAFFLALVVELSGAAA